MQIASTLLSVEESEMLKIIFVNPIFNNRDKRRNSIFVTTTYYEQYSPHIFIPRRWFNTATCQGISGD